MKANGKADLYFHAYFWEQYIKALDVQQSAKALNAKEAAVKSAASKKTSSEEKESDIATEPETFKNVPRIDIFSD